MTRINVDPIGRLRDFALASSEERATLVRQGVPSAQATFESSRKSSHGLARRKSGGKADDAIEELEVSKIAGKYGFVVRIDADAQSRNEPGVKLFRFADRDVPAGTFTSLKDVLQWLLDSRARPDMVFWPKER